MIAAAFVAAPLVSPSNDDLYALSWGGELWRGRLPALDGPLLPTAHPLNVVVSTALSPLGASGARYVFSAISLVALAVLVYASFRLGRRIGGVGVGLLAALLVASRPQLQVWAWEATVDVPFAALALLAAALIVEDPQRNRWKALALLVAAGLLRPEGWALTAIYGAWLISREGRPGTRAAIAALAIAPPLLWAAFDLALAGDPLFALHSAKGGGVHQLRSADFLAQGPVEAKPSGPARLADALPHVIGWPLLAVGAVAAVIALARLRRGGLGAAGRAEAGLAAVAIAGCTVFVALNLAGLPAHPRYLLLPGVTLVILAAGTVTWVRRSRRAAWALAAALVAMIALLPSDIAYLNRNVDEGRERFNAGRHAAAAVTGTHSRALLAICPRLVVGGTRRRLAYAGRAMAAAELERDPADVLLRRLPRTPPGTSAIAYVSFAGVRPGLWRFASACSGELGALGPAPRAGDSAARIALDSLSRP